MTKRSVEGALLSALQELGRVFGEERVMSTAGSVLKTAMQTKATVDGNVAAVLGLAGLPSRGDVEVLRRQLDVVQATLANLSRKLDRLMEEVAQMDSPRQPPGSASRSRTAARKPRRRIRSGADSPPG